MNNRTILHLSNTVMMRSKPGRGPLTEKLPNMKPRYGMQRDVVPTLQGGTRKMNSSGAPTR